MSLRRTTQQRWWRERKQCISLQLGKINPDLSHEDLESAAFALTLWGCAVVDLLHEPRCSDLVSGWLVQLTGSLTIRRIAAILKSVAEFLRDFYPALPCYSTIRTFRSFKRFLGLDSREVTLVMGPMVPSLVTYLEEHDSLSLGKLLTFTEFWSRIPIGSKELAKECEDSYLRFEQDFPVFRVTPNVIELRSIIRTEVEGLYLETSGRHSGGSTAEVTRHRGLIEKERHLMVPIHSRAARAAYLLQEQFPVEECQLASRWVSVTKNVLKRRSIAAEPTVMQFMQQAVLAGLAPWLRTSKFNIKLNEQEPNRMLAQKGSVDLDYGTIDLSNASDSVPYDLVKFIFGGTTIGSLILYTRTATMRIGGAVIPLRKFASMGSACCFPVESLIFKAIVLQAERHVGVHHRSEVYGDDIVCHEDCFDEVVRLLSEYGFNVNASKTFPPWHPFKESCGGEYLRGAPLQIFRLSRRFPGPYSPTWLIRTGGRPEKVSSYVAMLNDMWSAGFKTARSFALHELQRWQPAIPFGSPDSRGCIITSGAVRNDHLLSKKIGRDCGVDWQETAYTVRSFRPVQERPSDDDPLAVQAWLRAAEGSSRRSVTWPEDSVRPLLYPYRLESYLKAIPHWAVLSGCVDVDGEQQGTA